MNPVSFTRPARCDYRRADVHQVPGGVMFEATTTDIDGR